MLLEGVPAAGAEKAAPSSADERIRALAFIGIPFKGRARPLQAKGAGRS